MLKSNAPTLLMLALQALVYAAQNLGWLTGDQAMGLMATIATLGAATMHRMDPPKPKTADAAKVAIVLAVLTAGCSATFDESRIAGAHDRKLGASPGSADRCASLSDAEGVWSSLAKGSAVLAGGTALTPLHEEVREDKTARIVVASVAGGGAVFAAFSAHMASAKGGQFVRECQ